MYTDMPKESQNVEKRCTFSSLVTSYMQLMIKVKQHSCVEQLIVSDLFVCGASYHTQAALSCDMRAHKQTRSDTSSCSSTFTCYVHLKHLVPTSCMRWSPHIAHASWFTHKPLALWLISLHWQNRIWVRLLGLPKVNKCTLHTLSGNYVNVCRLSLNSKCNSKCVCPSNRSLTHICHWFMNYCNLYSRSYTYYKPLSWL